ncbi:MAG TPA: NAD(P)H-dependent oxidoreductase subunit E [Steroidobacteraceae bacterium]|nr:NAD(P)H-dependent oxidoreductase subunit E [Steroidobacteraceae bacterium]
MKLPIEAVDCEASVRRILERRGADPCGLVQVLREVQEALGCIPQTAMSLIAQTLGIPYSRVKGVASFYSFLTEEPALYRVLFSDDVTDHLAGSERLLERMCHRLWAEPGKISEDGLIAIDRTSCTGMCDQAPALLVNGWPVTALSEERIDRLCELMLARTPIAAWPAEIFTVEDPVWRADILLGNELAPGEPVRAALERGRRGSAERAANERSFRESFVGAAAGPLAMLDEIRRSNCAAVAAPGSRPA